jgi:hypothetical protein
LFENFPETIFPNFTVRNNFRCGIGKARSGKIPIPHRKYRYHIGFFRYHIGNTDVVSEKTDVVSEKTDVVSVFPMWHRYFRCGIGIFPLRAFSDTTSEIISNRVCLLVCGLCFMLFVLTMFGKDM